jgi:hypothetical protein
MILCHPQRLAALLEVNAGQDNRLYTCVPRPRKHSGAILVEVGEV